MDALKDDSVIWSRATNFHFNKLSADVAFENHPVGIIALSNSGTSPSLLTGDTFSK